MAPAPFAASAWRRGVWALLVLLALAGLGRSLWTPDEPREAEIAREMRFHPGVIPTLDGRPFYEKPPLYYWIVAAVFAATGPSPAGARSVSAVAGLLTLALLYRWAARAASPRRGLIAVALLATSFEFLVATHWVLLDPALMLFVSLALWAAWELSCREGGSRFLALFYGALVLALWTKGLVGVVVPLAGLAVYFLSERRRRPWRAFRPAVGVAVLALAVAALAAAIFAAGGREALYQWAWVNHVERFTNPTTTGHRQPIVYYLYTVPLVALPWLVPLADVFTRRFWSAAAPDAALRRFAGAVTGGGLLVLSLSSTKRETYLLPLLAPLFLLLAAAVDDRLAAADAGPSRGWSRAGEWSQAGLLALLAPLPGFALLLYPGANRASAAASAAVGVALAAVLLLATARRDARRAAVFAFAAAAALAATALLAVPPALESEKDLAPFVAALDARLPPGAAVPAIGADETLHGMVPFVTGRRVLDLDATGFGAAPDSSAPDFVLLQQKDGKPREVPGLESRYRLLASFGSARRWTLWRRAAK